MTEKNPLLTWHNYRNDPPPVGTEFVCVNRKNSSEQFWVLIDELRADIERHWHVSPGNRRG
jgi:hypothetical protein